MTQASSKTSFLSVLGNRTFPPEPKSTLYTKAAVARQGDLRDPAHLFISPL